MIARASAISFWFTPQRLATFFSHLWWTFMLHSAQKTKRYQTSSCVIKTWHLRTQFWSCWVCQRSFFDLSVKRVYSGQIWETELFSLLVLFYLHIEDVLATSRTPTSWRSTPRTHWLQQCFVFYQTRFTLTLNAAPSSCCDSCTVCSWWEILLWQLLGIYHVMPETK